MILCRRCKRLWPKGTIYCGKCGLTLGKRLCPEGHESHLTAQICTTCGSRKLTPATPSIGLRPLTWLIGLWLSWIAWTICILPLLRLLLSKLTQFGFLLLQTLTPLIVVSILVSVFCCEKGRTIIFNFWLGALKLGFRIQESLIRWVLPSAKKSKGKEKRS